MKFLTILICIIGVCFGFAFNVSDELGVSLLMLDVVLIVVLLIMLLKKGTSQLKRESATIVSTAIVNTTTIGKTKSSVKSSVVRGAVGGAVFGPIGAVAGAVTPKKTTVFKNDTVTFSILYSNGKRKVETVTVGSIRYNQLAKYLA